MFNIIINLREISLLRSALLFLSYDNKKLMERIGAYILLDVKKSFTRETSPYGQKWPEITEATFNNRVNPTNPILRDTGRLAQSFTFIAKNRNVQIGSNCIYAATQQFGAKRGQYGSMRNGSPIPWGDIPGRKMLPIANNRLALTFTQKKDIKQIIDEYISHGLSGSV